MSVSSSLASSSSSSSVAVTLVSIDLSTSVSVRSGVAISVFFKEPSEQEFVCGSLWDNRSKVSPSVSLVSSLAVVSPSVSVFKQA